MRLADYTNKFFNFLAENLRRLAELLSVKPSAENNGLDEEKQSLPPADWLEKTKDIPSGRWIDFSGEAADDLPSSLEESDTLSEESVEKQAESIQIAENSEIEKSFERAFTEFFPPNRKTDSRFLSFKIPERKLPNQTAEPPKLPVKIIHESFAENEKDSDSQPRQFRLLPSTHNKRQKSAVTTKSFVEIPVQKKSEPNQATSISKQRKPADKIKEGISLKTEKVTEKQSQIVDKTIARKKIPFKPDSQEGFEKRIPKTKVTETVVQFPKPKEASDFIFESNSKNAAEMPEYFPVWKKNTNNTPENEILRHQQQNTGTGEDFFFAAPRWVDLPEEFSSDAFAEIETSRSEAEHLLFLEREQAGTKNNKDKD